MDPKAAVEAMRAGDEGALRAALEGDPELARSPRLVVEAGRRADLAALRLLLARGADPNARQRGYRALHALIQERPEAQAEEGAARLACLDLLLERGASPELTGAFPPASALLVAAFSGEPAMAERLVAAGARVDVFAAAALGRRKLVERALRDEPAFAQARAEGGMTALQCACASRLHRASRARARDLLAIATLLLDSGADPNATVKSWSDEVDTAYFAIGAADRERTELLLTRGADPTAALPSALWTGDEELAELILAHGARIDAARSNGHPVLNDMVRWGRVTETLWLLEHGASPNLSGPEGWTALHLAASRGNRRMVEALLADGADRTRVDDSGRTALDVARERGRGALELLLR